MAYNLFKEGKRGVIVASAKGFKLIICIIKDLLTLPNDLISIVNPRQTVFI